MFSNVSFPPSGTVRSGTVWYGTQSLSEVVNSELYRTTFLVPFRCNTAKRAKRVELNSLLNVDWFTSYKHTKTIQQCILYFYIFTHIITVSQYAFLSVLVDV